MSKQWRDYRKLGPTWQGFFAAAALFTDEHCLISVRSFGFEEQVKRFNFNDIQALVISKSRRFALSRRITIGVLLVVLGTAIAYGFSRRLGSVISALDGAILIAWLYISIAASCRCTLYTAVNKEELSSIRRRWTARRVMAELSTWIETTQGTLPLDWTENVPSDRAIVPGPAGPATTVGSQFGSVVLQRARISATGALVVALLTDIILTVWDLNRLQPVPASIGYLLTFVEASMALWVLIQNRGVHRGLQWLGGIVLAFLALFFYAQSGVAAFLQAQMKRPLQANELHSLRIYRIFEEVYLGGCVLLCVMAVFLVIVAKTPRPKDDPAPRFAD